MIKKKAYDAYKTTQFKWIEEIPKHWSINKIKYTTYVKGRIGWQGLKSDEFIDEGPFLVTGTDFKNGEVNWNSCYHISEERYKEAPPIQLKENDLLITKDGSIGKLAIVTDKPEKAILNSGIFVTRPLNADYYPKFLFWMLSSKVFDDFIRYYEIGSTIKHLYQETFVNFSFPLPKIEEQINISSFLDEMCGNTDEIIALKKQQIETLKKYRQSIITEIVTKGLNPSVKMKDSGNEWIGKIPLHWDIKKIKNILLPNKGAIKTGPFGSQLTNQDMEGGEVKVFNQRNVLDNDFSKGDNYISKEKFCSLRGFEVFPDDILVTTRGTIGKVAIAHKNIEKGILHPCLIRIQVNQNNILPDYLKYIFNETDLIKEQVFLLSNATTIEVIYSETLKNIIIPIPSTIEEQIKIVKYLDTRINDIDSAIIKISEQIDILEKYIQSLIYEAVTGKIDVRNYKETDLEV